MCYNPITIINPTKYVSLKYRDRYLIQVPCGRCAACMTNKSNEWYYRIYYHALDMFNKNNGSSFVQFVTLTYDNKHLPHISDYIPVSKDVDFQCFSSEDLRTFVARLRQTMKRKFSSNFDYFIVSEYGTSEKHLHRPHYHALFFVKGSISPLEFSSLVTCQWKNGRTDGYPFRSSVDVNYNTFTGNDEHFIRSIRYISKYIQKSCKFQTEIDFRLDKIMANIVNKFESQGLDNWSESSHYWRVRDAISRKVNQFHRQSTFLGASVIDKLDIANIFFTGSLFVPDKDNVILKISLPTYFKRKLFYHLVEIDGAQTWQPTDLGYQYLEYRLEKVVQNLADRFKAISLKINKVFDYKKLADYVLNYRGRFVAEFSSTIEERLQSISLYNYSTRYDRESLGQLGLSLKFLGNSSVGYKKRAVFIRFRDFIQRYVYLNDDYEEHLKVLFAYSRDVDAGRQAAYQEKQRLRNLYHSLIV